MSQNHKVFTHVDITEKLEAESILVDKFAQTEAAIAKTLSKAKQRTFLKALGTSPINSTGSNMRMRDTNFLTFVR